MPGCRIRKTSIPKENSIVVELGLEDRLSSIEDAKNYVNVLEKSLNECLDSLSVSLRGSEVIGQRYTIYKYDVIGETGECRIITDNKANGEIIHTVCVIEEGSKDVVDVHDMEEKRHIGIVFREAPRGPVNTLPKGQKLIPKPVVYAVYGLPSIDLGKWRLIVDGLVENPLRLSYNDLLSLPQASVKAMFHCVTGWSIREQVWEGVELWRIAGKARIEEEAKWVFVESLDGYTTIIPLEDFLHPQSLLVLRVNGEPLSPEHGFPARILVPHLYGWKHAKWVKRIMFREDYVDGYWETLGYHGRGNVLLEERFKNTSY